jgi:hypothetical protein
MGADLYIKDMPRKRQYTGYVCKPKVGYFRDAYNPWGLFWNMKLSWWQTYETFKLGDNDSEMTPEQIPEFKKIIQDTWNKLPDKFEVRDFKDNPIHNKEDFEEHYNQLIEFLKIAEEKKSNIIFSV